MNSMVIYGIGFFLGTFFGLVVMAIHAIGILKGMGLWVLVKSWMKGADLELNIQCRPLDDRSKRIVQKLVDRSVRRGEVRKIEEDENAKG